jgi:hypothetical protein
MKHQPKLSSREMRRYVAPASPTLTPFSTRNTGFSFHSVFSGATLRFFGRPGSSDSGETKANITRPRVHGSLGRSFCGDWAIHDSPGGPETEDSVLIPGLHTRDDPQKVTASARSGSVQSSLFSERDSPEPRPGVDSPSVDQCRSCVTSATRIPPIALSPTFANRPENNPHPRPKLLGSCPFRPQTM